MDDNSQAANRQHSSIHAREASESLLSDSSSYAIAMDRINRISRCPNCQKRIARNPLVRADILFSDWGSTRKAGEKAVEFYI